MKDEKPTALSMPAGFALTLALHPAALQHYAELDRPAQADLLRRAESATTRREMQALIKELEEE